MPLSSVFYRKNTSPVILVTIALNSLLTGLDQLKQGVLAEVLGERLYVKFYHLLHGILSRGVVVTIWPLCHSQVRYRI